MPFEDKEIYLADDRRLRKIAAKQTMARWRHEGIGPNYVKIGGRVVYIGADLNSYVASRRIVTRPVAA